MVPTALEALAPSVTRTRYPRTVALLSIGLLVVWGLVFRKVGEGDVYASLGPLALVVIATSSGFLWLDRRATPEAERRTPRFPLGRTILIGALVGVVMTAGTYAAYALAERLVPSLASHMQGLYAAARTESLGAAIAWTLVSVVAEELLWRGLLLRALAGRVRPRVAGAIAVTAYVLVQVGSGSWVIALAALVCGAIWTTERIALRAFSAPMLSHAIWTVTVIHLYPVNGR